MKVEIGSINIGFPKNIKIENIFIADHGSDTLLFCRKLFVDTDLIPILFKKINIDHLLIEGLKANVYKSKSDSLFNFSPLIDVFGNGKKDTIVKAKSPWEIGFDEIELQSIEASYRNQIDSSKILLNLGHLLISSNAVNAIGGEFDIEKIDLQQTSLSIVIDSNKTENNISFTKKDVVKFPFDINLNEANLENLHFDLKTSSGNLSLDADLHQATLLPKKLDLKNFDIEMKNLMIDGAEVSLQIIPESPAESIDASPSQKAENSDFTFANIPWNFLVNHAEIANTSYKMDLDTKPRSTIGMDYWHMMFSDFNLIADSIFFNKDQTGAKVQELNVSEISGANLSHLEGQFFMDNKSILAKKISMATDNSTIKGSASLGYSSLREIGTHIEKLQIISDLHGYIDINEISPFTSVLKSYPLLSNLNKIEVENIKVSGTLDNMTLINCKAGIGQSTSFLASGHIYGLPSTDMKIQFALDTLTTSQHDIVQYFPDTLLPKNISLPKNIGLSASLNYQPKSMELLTSFQTEFGGLSAETQMIDEKLSVNFNVNDIDIGKIMNDSAAFGELNVEGQIKADLADGNFNKFNTKINVQSMDLYGYLYNNLQFDLERNNETFSFSTFIEDTAISYFASGEAILLETSNHYNVDLKVEHADLKQLNIVDEDFVVKAYADINTNFTSADDIEGTFSFTDIMLSNPRGTYKIEEINLDADIKKEYTNFDFTTDIFDASLSGNSKIKELKNAFNNHINNYIKVPDSLLVEKEHHFDFNLTLKNPDFFTDFLIDDLNEIGVENCSASYDGSNDLFLANINISKLKYANWEFDSLSIAFNSEGDSIISNIGVEQILIDSLNVNNLSLSAKFANQNANLKLSIADSGDSLQYLIETHATYIDSSYIINLIPGQLIIDHRSWEVNPENKLKIKNKKFTVESAAISFEKQKILLESDSQNHLKLMIEQFDINNIIGFLEKDEDKRILNGKINGFVEVTEPFGKTRVKTNLKIQELELYNNQLGDFTTIVDFTAGEEIDYSFLLSNESNDIKLDGILNLNSDKLETNATLIAEIADAKVYSVFFNKYLSDLSGGLNSNIEITGNIEAPELTGQMKFNDFSMTVNSANSLLNANGELIINSNKMSFSNFTLSDSLQNHLSFKGGIDAKNIQNPFFDIKIISPEFMAINSKWGKDKSIVGNLLLGIDIDVKGHLSELKVNSGFTINKNTDIMYVLPGKDLELITDNGIVVFTDFKNQTDTLITVKQEQFIGDSIMALIRGIDVTIELNIDPEAQFSIYVDPNSGDITFFKLKGNLRYKYNDVQRGYLTGLIELEEGYYDLSFYGLVKKKFVYDPGSTISWSGNVMEGVVNFTARHEVKTNSVGLVSNEISSYERSLYNQRLPYEVLLNIDGQISEPVISFGIELPDRYKNDNPTIASKLQTLQHASMESELNKQVFALLVGGTFIPENPDVNEGSSSSNFATTAARNSVNAIMTQQLNKLTGQFIKGIDVDMGLNTFDDYASGKANTRTQLDVKVSKNLFNNRVSAEVESHIDLEGSNSNPGTQSTAGMTEFAVSYRLTESGNYSIKAFRENAWDIFDGEIQNSGIAFIFIKEFDSFKKDKSND